MIHYLIFAYFYVAHILKVICCHITYCKECKKLNTGYDWCNTCNAKHFRQNFINWTSGNIDIDKCIQDTQLSAKSYHKILEWIPYGKLHDIEYIAKGGFGRVYRAKWVDGYIQNWDHINKDWKRVETNMYVALKSLNNSENITSEFINEITLHHKIVDNNYFSFIVRIYGITQDPVSKNYMMILDYADYGSLRNYLDKNYNKLSWYIRLNDLYFVAFGLEKIHIKELVHRDLHIGNVIRFAFHSSITDMGLCKPADFDESKSMKNSIYGVLPYIAPEVLRGHNYTKAADIYSFGIIMYEVISGLPPYHDLSHDKNLAIKICHGLRPRFNIKVPELIVSLIKKCLDANPLNRPKAEEIRKILDHWVNQSEVESEIANQIKEAEEINYNLSTGLIPSNYLLPSANLGLSYKTHSEAIYTSRLFNFNNLPEQKNSDDYYQQYDNIISREFSESLQIDVPHLNINDYLERSTND
ncbi:kinase-like domain-containing protein [Rhizophagus clarus]|uniref:Kinase-like domain-containing protein n=1 Tax=Rhizophagus clarus TaxID=94130 RepID=A0A8H3QSM4_9GLOM|nr:kinase-like domain-containing protein [Rhizophagus clarus]